MAKENWIKKHPVWSGVIGVFLLFILIGIFSGGDNSSTTNTQPAKEEIKFSGSITDNSGDCESSQSGNPIQCKGAVDITSATLIQENGLATVTINLAEDIPAVSELKEIEDENYIFWPEIYQYVLSVRINNEWKDVLFGDLRADTKKAEGGCGPIYIVDKNIGSCDDSQVTFLVEGNKITIKGPLQPKITDFKIETLYEAPSMEEDNIIDVAES